MAVAAILEEAGAQLIAPSKLKEDVGWRVTCDGRNRRGGGAENKTKPFNNSRHNDKHQGNKHVNATKTHRQVCNRSEQE